MVDLSKIESFEDTQSRKFFKKKDNENKVMIVTYKGHDPARNHFGEQKKMVNLDLMVLEEDGSVTEYTSQWVDGAYIYATLTQRPVGESLVRKLVKMPPQAGSSFRSWGFKAPDQESYDKLIAYVKQQQEAVEEALASDEVPDFLKDSEEE